MTEARKHPEPGVAPEPADEPARAAEPPPRAAGAGPGAPPPASAGGPDEPAAGPAGEGPSAVEQDLEELVGKARERDEYLALAQRTQADFENFRKRAAKEAAAAERRGVARLAKELLPALDNLARALEAATPEDEHLAAGIRLVQSELLAALERVGVEGFSPQGEPFDPNEHEAMAQQPVEGAASGTVAEVYQQGYRIAAPDAGQPAVILRPARVVVAE